ncbi:MAG: B12-binding domain-containing radical SAM protein [Candidatus Sumerlaeaceae bacterium]|nr:B12-binding domain-containing radical SAM protein [Candidatus Sumerlaeaceae bacterium]
MDVLIAHFDSGGPSRLLRMLETGIAHQMLADAQVSVGSVLVPPGAGLDVLLNLFRHHTPRVLVVIFDEFAGPMFLERVARLKSVFPDIPACAAGVGATLMPDRVMNLGRFDCMVVGEPEVALLEVSTALLDHREIRQIRNLWYRTPEGIGRNPLRPVHDNLDTLPYANRSLFEQDPAPAPGAPVRLPVVATRGCPYDCLFCYSPVLKKAYEGKGVYYRMRSAQNLTGEINGLLRQHPEAMLVFVDEMFPVDKSWLRAFRQRFGGAAGFEATIACDKTDEEVLDLMAGAGCRRIVLGLESGSDAVRRRIATRNLSLDRLRLVAAEARKRGMQVVVSNMVGLPVEDEAALHETWAVDKALEPDEIRCTVYQPIPGTSLHLHCTSSGMLTPGTERAITTFDSPSLSVPGLPQSAIVSALQRVHFLNAMEVLRGLPQAEAHVDLLAQLPRARMRLPQPLALSVGRARRGSVEFAFLAVGAGVECRWPIQLRPGLMLRFALAVPAATLRALTADAVANLELLWRGATGEETVFYQSVTAGQKSLAGKWRDCLAALPDTSDTGELVLRVSAPSDCAAQVLVLVGAPLIVEESAAGEASGVHKRAELEAALIEREREIERLRQELSAAREREMEARSERDEKARRVGELHNQILALQQTLEEQRPLVEEMQRLQAEKAAGLSGRLRAIFKKE